MSYKDDLTGKGKQFGNHVSHSQRHVKRAWKPNLQIKTLVIDGQKVRLKLAASTIRTLNKYQKQLESKEQAVTEVKKASKTPATRSTSSGSSKKAAAKK
jgi:large subunit ribosomal protein L28